MLLIDKIKIIGNTLKNQKIFLKILKGSLLELRNNDLLKFANKYNTDKGVPGHNYARVYNAFLQNRRDDIKSLCEIGLLLGRFRSKERSKMDSESYKRAPSLNMWQSYFPKARIVGFDIKKFENPKNKNQIIIQGDQGSRKDLRKIIKTQSQLDVIIDDGSHASKHQQVSLSFLFPHLAPGGIYFIEDLKCQPGGLEQKDVPKTILLLKQLQGKGIWNSPLAFKDEKESIESQVEQIYFFDGLKCYKPEDPKKFSDNLAVIVKK